MNAGSSQAEDKSATAIIASRMNRFGRSAFRPIQVINAIVIARNSSSKARAAAHAGTVESRNWVIDSTWPRAIQRTNVDTCQAKSTAPAAAKSHVGAPRPRRGGRTGRCGLAVRVSVIAMLWKLLVLVATL